MLEWIHRKNWPDLVAALGCSGTTVDIGLGRGEFSAEWQKRSPSDSHFGIDLWSPRSFREWPHFDNQQSEEHWSSMKRDCEAVAATFQNFTILQEDALECAGRFEDGSLDAVWLDASHNYSFVYNALKEWWRKLKPGGLLGGASFLNSFHRFEGNPHFMWIRTRQAVEDFAREIGRHAYTNQEGWPSYLLSKPCSSLPKITVVSGGTSDLPWTDVVKQNHEEYCDRHGFEYRWFDFEFLDRHPVWGKIFACAKIIEDGGTDWVVWLDSDAIFVDLKKPLFEFLVEGTDAILPEWCGKSGRRKASSGVMFWRSNERSLEVLKKIWKAPERVRGYSGEEDAMANVLWNFPELCAKCLLVDHRHFNSMMSAYIGWNDNRDFIIHIGQVSEDKRFGILADLQEEAHLRGKAP